jgi:hypothetical protein
MDPRAYVFLSVHRDIACKVLLGHKRPWGHQRTNQVKKRVKISWAREKMASTLWSWIHDKSLFSKGDSFARLCTYSCRNNICIHETLTLFFLTVPIAGSPLDSSIVDSVLSGLLKMIVYNENEMLSKRI